jgi:hypothetical protein
MPARFPRPLLLVALLLPACAPAAPRTPEPAITLSAPEPWTRTELFIGLSKPAGGHVNHFEWAAFESELARDFPDGFTLVDARGGWSDPHRGLVRENSRILIVCYPSAKAADMDAALEKAGRDAIRRLGQAEILRVDSPISVSFFRRAQAQH